MQTKRVRLQSRGGTAETKPLANDLPSKSAVAIDIDEALRLFVDRVRAIEYVDEIRCVREGGYYEVWTFISSPPFEAELRFPIYDVEWEITERVSEPTLDFRVVNTRELDCEDESMIAPAGGRLLWK